VVTKKRKKKKPAKAPPPPQRKAKRTPMTAKALREVIATKPGRPLQTSVEEEPASWPYLRYAAGRHYATDFENMCSVEDMTKIPMFSVVPEATLRYWCARDGWVERRKDFLESVRKKEEHVVGTALVQARIHQLAKTQDIMDKAYDLVMVRARKKLAAHSMEGVMNAYARLCQLSDDQREKLATSLFPDAAEGQPQTQPLSTSMKPRLSVEEQRAAALVIVRMRREEIRAALRAEEDEKSGTETPHIRVVEGER